MKRIPDNADDDDDDDDDDEEALCLDSVALKKAKKSNDDDNDNDDIAEEDRRRLSSDPAYNIPQLTRYLRRIGFLDSSLGVREVLESRDPMLIVLYNPGKRIRLSEGEEVMVIDDLLRSAYAEFERAYGAMFMDFEMIQFYRKALLESFDIHAKQMCFLCMLAIDDGLRDQFRSLYPQDGGQEVDRLDPFIAVVKRQMDETLNTAYVNVPRPTPYNVDVLTTKFLLMCAWSYPG